MQSVQTRILYRTYGPASTILSSTVCLRVPADICEGLQTFVTCGADIQVEYQMSRAISTYTGTGTAYGPYAVLLIGIVLILIRNRIRISRSRSGLVSNQFLSTCGSYPKFYICWKIRFFTFGHGLAT